MYEICYTSVSTRYLKKKHCHFFYRCFNHVSYVIFIKKITTKWKRKKNYTHTYIHAIVKEFLLQVTVLLLKKKKKKNFKPKDHGCYKLYELPTKYILTYII